MRRPRFTVRGLMVAVAIVGVMIAMARLLDHLARQSGFYANQAALHARSETRMLAMLAQAEKELARCKDPAVVRERWARSGLSESSLGLFIQDDAVPAQQAANFRRMLSYHAEMRRRYESATWRPWQSVTVDPMPEWGP